MINILVIEDEQRAGEKLIRLIEQLDVDHQLSWKRSVEDGIQILNGQDQFDLIFSDIELLDGNAFEIYQKVRPTCPIIFCTAYDQYFVDAFQTNGIAYLLKPYTDEQFHSVWEKFQLLFKQEKKPTPEIPQNLLSLIEQFQGNTSENYKTVFSVKKRDGVLLLKVENISFFQAQGDFVVAVDQQNNKHILNLKLSTIEESIDPKLFFRINRSELVKLDAIEGFSNYSKNKLAIKIKQPKMVLYSSGGRTPAFRQWIESS